jgi:hypothetical protein
MRALSATLFMGVAYANTGNPEIYEGLILGVGPGTFAVILSSIVGMLMCLFKDAVSAPTLCILGGIIIPLITLAIVKAIPIKSLESD